MLHPLDREVRRQARALLPPGAGVVVAVSGGPDSTALLEALAAAAPAHDLSLVVAHLDHGWRGPAAARADLAAVAAQAERLGLPLESARRDAHAELARRGNGSLEAASRALRYRFLGEVAARRGAAWVALGHTADDQAETVLLRTLRGTSLRGLGGMPRRRRLSRAQPDVQVVRPLLSLRRELVEDYLRTHGVDAREDPSNRDPRWTRARLRHELLPTLRERLNPAVEEALLRLAGQARRAERTLARLARELLAGARRAPDRWDAERLRAADPGVRATALAQLVRREAPDRLEARHVRAIERLLRAGRGAVSVPGATRFHVAEGLLVRGPERTAASPAPSRPALELPVPGGVIDSAAGRRIEARIVERAQARWRDADPARRACFDLSRVSGRLTVRRRRAGDRFWPLGAPGQRSLKRFCIDHKIPRSERDGLLVVTHEDQPVWLVGHRIDERYKVTPTTARVLELRTSAVDGQEEGSRP